MIDVVSHKTAEFPVPAAKIWELIADFGGIAKWWPPGVLTKVDVEGEGVGMVRHMHTAAGVLSERLEALDPAARHLELSIVGDMPSGITGYRARGIVREQGPGACVLDWRGTYQVPTPEDEAGARAFIEGAYAAQFKGLLDHVTGAGSKPA